MLLVATIASVPVGYYLYLGIESCQTSTQTTYSGSELRCIYCPGVDAASGHAVFHCLEVPMAPVVPTRFQSPLRTKSSFNQAISLCGAKIKLA